MIQSAAETEAIRPIILVDIGNSATKLAIFKDDRVMAPVTIDSPDADLFEATMRTMSDACEPGGPAAIVVASVFPEILERVRGQLHSSFDREPLVVGENLDYPIELDVKDASKIGADRVCASAAAYARLEDACVVVDFGTAVTVDVVNEGGTLLGGAILPGVQMQFQSLQEHTAQLPHVEAAFPELVYGRDTTEAIQNGVCRGIAGSVRWLVESYASELGRWPQVVATGGDLEFMAPACDFLDTLVVDLTMQGIALAYVKRLVEGGA